MLKGVSELRVFVASPSDLSNEREAIRALETSLNITYAAAEIRVRITGWEDLPPGFGRPQGQINPLVDDCHIFIGLLRRKWGTETGEHETGFMEEFERTVERRKADGTEPEIALYFAEMSKAEIDDAGPDLTRVLAFRKRVETERIALYSTFESPEDLVRQVESLLNRHVLRLALEKSSTPQPDSAVSGTSAQTKSDADAKSATEGAKGEEGIGLDSAGAQIKATLDSLHELLAGRTPTRPLDHDRLELVGIALGKDDNPLGTHLVNRLYCRRDELELIVAEHDAWVATLMADIGSSNGPETRVVPGWALILPEHEDAPGLLARIATLGDEVGRGALRSLLRLNIRPASLWPRALSPGPTIATESEPIDLDLASNWTDILNAHPGRSAALDYLLQDLDSTDQGTLKAVRDLLATVASNGELNGRTRKLIVAAQSAIDGETEELADALGYSSGDSAQWRLVLRHPDKLSDKLINQFAGQTANRRARIAAITAGLAEDRLSDNTLTELLLIDDEPEIADLLVQAAAEDPARSMKYIGLMNDQTKTKLTPSDTEARLLASAASIEQLEQLLSSSDYSILPWEALTYATPESLLEEARDVLRSNAARLRAELEPKIDEKHKRLIDYLADDQRRAAADLLSRQADPFEDDIDLILAWFSSEAEGGHLRNHSWRVLPRIANSNTLAKIEQTIRPHLEVIGFRRAVDHLEGPLAPAIAAVLLTSDEEVLQEPAQRWHIQQPERTNDELREALYAPQAAVRVAAAQALTLRLDRDQLLALHAEYPNAGGRYWYNVIALFDEYLYAPSPSADSDAEREQAAESN